LNAFNVYGLSENPETGLDQHLYRADDGIRTRDPNLGEETQVVCSVPPRPLSRHDASTTSTPSVASVLVCSSPLNALNVYEQTTQARLVTGRRRPPPRQ
jgi:hypothetical protein